MDWTKLVEGALVDLGGKSVCVPGAKLHGQVSRLGFQQGEDFSAYLRSQGLTFSQFLDRFKPRLLINRRPGADILVGFQGAVLPAGGHTRSKSDSFLRDDVYAAFTRVSAIPFVYVAKVDRFTTDPGDEEETVGVPGVTLESLLAQRKAFANSIGDEDSRQRLIESVERSPTPLISFQRTLSALGLHRGWHDFKYQDVKSRIRKWAEEAGVTPSESWFTQSADAQSIETPQKILSELARHMSDEEIRNIAIPFRAVEEFYRALPRKQSS